MRYLNLIVFAWLSFGMSANAASPHYPQHVSGEAAPTAAQKAAVNRAFAAEVRRQDGALTKGFSVVGQADLNGDGRPDLILITKDEGFCGAAGCSMFALLRTAKGYAAKGIDLATAYGGVTVLATVHRGMHDLKYDGSDGYVFKWNGKEYQ